jgi:hypothetical protein
VILRLRGYLPGNVDRCASNRLRRVVPTVILYRRPAQGPSWLFLARLRRKWAAVGLAEVPGAAHPRPLLSEGREVGVSNPLCETPSASRILGGLGISPPSPPLFRLRSSPVAYRRHARPAEFSAEVCSPDRARPYARPLVCVVIFARVYLATNNYVPSQLHHDAKIRRGTSLAHGCVHPFSRSPSISRLRKRHGSCS